MPATYEPIATTTLSSAASTITFSSIPSTYTDLRLTLVSTTSAAVSIFLRFNSSSTLIYSQTRLIGNGSAASSDRSTSLNRIQISSTTSTTIPQFQTTDIFSYAGSTKKTVLGTSLEDGNGSGNVIYGVGLWDNTAAINTVTYSCSSGTFNVGTTATLYGIKAA